jgi:hypothetical protein
VNKEGRVNFALAMMLAAAGALIGYLLPFLGTLAIVCLVLMLIVAFVGENGFKTDFVAVPFRVLSRWLSRNDASRWVKRAPIVGLVAGSLIRWVANGMTATGGV